MLYLIPIVGGLLIMMGQHDRSEALLPSRWLHLAWDDSQILKPGIIS